MTPYTTIPKDILTLNSNNRFIDTLVFAYIKSRRDFKTDISQVTEQEISTRLRISSKSTSTVKSCISRLRQNTDLLPIIETKEQIDNTGYKTYNRYHFNSEDSNFFYIYNSLFNDEVDNKVKGFVIQLKALCINETNVYLSSKPIKGKVNKAELARRLGIDKSTLDNLLEKAINANYIKEIDDGLFISCPHIIPDFIASDSKPTLYHQIYYWCLENDIIPPTRDDIKSETAQGVRRTNSILSHLTGKYNITDDGIDRLAESHQMNRNEFLEYADRHIDKFPVIKHYAPYVLSKRVKNKPSQVNLQYIAQVLGYGSKQTHNNAADKFPVPVLIL